MARDSATVGPTNANTSMSDSTMMPAAVIIRYNKTALVVSQRPIPTASSLDATHVLVRVHVVALNPADIKMRSGEVKVFRGKPTKVNPVTLGCDFAGEITAVSTESFAHGFQVGDRVFGMSVTGALAPFTVANVNTLAKIPDGIGMGQAAMIVTAGITALQMLMQAGVTSDATLVRKLLITAGPGGVGHLAIQMAKNLFKINEVTTTASKGKIEFVKACGADVVVDYKAENFSAVLTKGSFDAALDCTGETAKCKKVVKKDGIIVSILGIPDGIMLSKVVELYQMPSLPCIVVPLLNGIAWLKSSFSAIRVINIIALPHASELTKMGQYCADGLITPTLDRVYTLEQAAEAFDYVEQGHVVGKVLVEIVPESTAGLEQRCPLVAAQEVNTIVAE